MHLCSPQTVNSGGCLRLHLLYQICAAQDVSSLAECNSMVITICSTAAMWSASAEPQNQIFGVKKV